jgi:ABC-type branched-subunit amino acid transport system permease subunit
VVLLLPHVAGTRLPLYTTALAEVTLFASLSLLVRMSRQVSLCQIAFSAVGACVSARAVGAGIPWGAALVLGGLVAIPVGALVAIPAIRLSGVYLAIATFGFGLVVQRMFYPTFLMFGASLEIHAPRPDFAPLQTSGDVGYYYVVLAVTLASAGALALLRRSRGGRLLRAFADSATAVDAHGTDTNELKVLVFCISAFFAAIAGALMAPVTGTAAGGSVRAVGGFDASVSLLVISVLFIAGRQPLLSAIAASVIFVVIPGYMSAATSQKYAPVAFGILAVGAAMSSGRSIIERLRASERIRERIVEGSPQQHRRFAHQLSASVEAR